MKPAESRRARHIPVLRDILIALTFVFAGLIVFFGVQFITKSGVFRQPGQLIFADSITESTRNFITTTLGEITLKYDVTVSATTTLGQVPAASAQTTNEDTEGTEDAEANAPDSDSDSAAADQSSATIGQNAISSDQSSVTATVLYNILLPVTDFYNPRLSISAAEAWALLDPAHNPLPDPADTSTDVSDSIKSDPAADSATDGTIDDDTDLATDSATSLISLISIWNLEPETKLLAIDDAYYLDTLNSGAFFESLVFSGANAEDVLMVSGIIRNHIESFPVADELFTLAQTGVTALSRNMNAKLNAVGGDANYFAANIGSFLSQFDLTHTSNESSFSEYATSSNICSDPRMIDALTAIGLDIVELTGNHNQDCGDDAAISTISLYQDLGIATVGGGITATDAATPLEISTTNTKITLLAYNLSTGGYTLDDTPGANFYTREKAIADIAAAKERGDFIIVDIQYYECNEYVDTAENTTCDFADSAAGDQIGFFRELIDLGADIVVGTAAHQPQTYELYGDGVIYYGLGNLFFDQNWWPGTTRSLILVHYFYDGRYVQTRLVPTVYDASYQTKLMDTADAETFLARLLAARPSA